MAAGKAPIGTEARPSASADASRAAELERIRRMSPLERMALALALGRRRQALDASRPSRAPGSDR